MQNQGLKIFKIFIRGSSKNRYKMKFYQEKHAQYQDQRHT